MFRRETIVKIISVSTGTSFVYIITSKFGHVGIYDDKLRLQRRYEIDIDTDPDSDLDVAASDPGWITDAVWMDNSKHMVYTSSLRLEQQLLFLVRLYSVSACKYRYQDSKNHVSL